MPKILTERQMLKRLMRSKDPFVRIRAKAEMDMLGKNLTPEERLEKQLIAINQACAIAKKT